MTERQKLAVVIMALEAAGYDSRAQLTGYARTGNAAYITRLGGARELIGTIQPQTIQQYLG